MQGNEKKVYPPPGTRNHTISLDRCFNVCKDTGVNTFPDRYCVSDSLSSRGARVSGAPFFCRTDLSREVIRKVNWNVSDRVPPQCSLPTYAACGSARPGMGIDEVGGHRPTWPGNLMVRGVLSVPRLSFDDPGRRLGRTDGARMHKTVLRLIPRESGPRPAPQPKESKY